MNIIPVIIAGGRGTRLWPLSRDQLPKQFISLDGEASLLQNTISKLLDLGCKTPIIVCNLEHRFVVSAQIKKFDIEPRIILEPAGRDTAPAIALAAMISGSNDKLFIVSSDLMLPDKKDFSDAIQKGIDLSGNGKIVTFGVLPTSPHTGYGYIKCSDPLGSGFKIQKFQEKPNLKTAKQYLDSGEYFWNAGMFLFEAQDILKELQIHTPLVYKTCMEAIQKSSQDDSYIRIPEEIFSQCPSMSIDYAVMEKTSNAIMIEMNGSWSDLGSWNSVWEHLPQDKNSNVLSGNIKAFDTSNSLIFSEDKLSVSIGLDSIIAINTKDALLIAHKDKLDEFKNITQALRETNQDEIESHVKVYRPWGHYEALDSGASFQVKRLTVYPNQKLSVQKHKHRSEHWVVVSGEAQVLKNEETFTLKQNESTYLPAGCIHSLENKSLENLIIIEVQSGSYLGEDDIIRLEDRYGRIDGK